MSAFFSLGNVHRESVVAGVAVKKIENRLRSSILLVSSVANYSATTLSQATLSQQTALSQAVLSAHSVPVVLLPQEAKETATIAANTNANFFIFFYFLIL